MPTFTYANDSDYEREFFDLDGRTVTLGPRAEVTFDHAVEHPNLVPVSEEAVADAEAEAEAQAEQSTAVRARDEQTPEDTTPAE